MKEPSRRQIHPRRFGLCLALLLCSSVLASRSFAALEYTGGIYYDDLATLTAEKGWYAFESLDNTIYIGRADGEWGPLDPSELALGGGIGAAKLTRDVCFALVLRNTSTNAFHCFAVAYYAEQWAVVTDIPNNFAVRFAWGVFESFTTGLPNGIANPSTILPHTADKPEDFTLGYSGDPALDAQAFVFGTTQIGLNGNSRKNRQRHASVLDGAVWKPGEYLVLRWFLDYNLAVVSQVLAVDDLSFRAAVDGQIEFLAVESTSANQIQLTACGLPGANHELQESTDLRSWQRVASSSGDTGKLTFPVNSSNQYRFYRLIKR